MDIVVVAIIIVATFAAGLVRYFGLGRKDVPDAVTYALGIGLALLIFAAGPRVLGG